MLAYNPSVHPFESIHPSPDILLQQYRYYYVLRCTSSTPTGYNWPLFDVSHLPRGSGGSDEW